MHVNAVADELRGDFVGLQNRAGEAGRAMVERRHAVEQMRRLAGAGGDCRERFLVGRRRMTERHAMSARRSHATRSSAAVELRRERDDADVGRRALDLAQSTVRSRRICVFRIGLQPPRLNASRAAAAGRRAAARRRIPG